MRVNIVMLALVAVLLALASLFYRIPFSVTGVVGPSVVTVFVVVRYFQGRGPRLICQRQIAAVVRSILDRHLVIDRIDPVGFGDFMTLRIMAAASRDDRLDRLTGYGTAYRLGDAIAELAHELEIETGRNYHRLRGSGRTRVDAFAAQLRRAAAAGHGMLNPPPLDPADPHAASRRDFERLGAALIGVERAGDELDRAFDPEGSAAGAAARASSAEERQRREGQAAAVLLRCARNAAQELQLPSVQHAVPIVALAELTGRLGRAVAAMRCVDQSAFTGAFHDATDDARSAYRWLSQHDLGDALEAAMRLAKDPKDAAADAVLRDRLERFPRDLAALEGVRDGRVRDVAHWPGAVPPGTPTLR